MEVLIPSIWLLGKTKTLNQLICARHEARVWGQVSWGGFVLVCLFCFFFNFVCLMLTLRFQAHCALAGKRQPEGADRDKLHWTGALLSQAVVNTSREPGILPNTAEPLPFSSL